MTGSVAPPQSAGERTGLGYLMKRALVAATAIATLSAGLFLSCRAALSTTDPMGPNAGCYVCHMTFVQEELATTHLHAGISCVRCHGTSAGHANDENIGATTPDVMIKGAQINPFCRACHKTHNAAPEKVVARWTERHPAELLRALQTPPPAATCTECHGHHKIAKRPS